MDAKTKYTISVKSNSHELLEQIYCQMENSFGVDNRAKKVFSKGIIFNEKENSITMEITFDSGFTPVVMYGYDQNLPQILPDNATTEVIIKCHGMKEEDMYKKVGEPTHMQFCGLNAYVDSDIVINVNYKEEVYVGFSKCCYYPIIGLVYGK